MIPLIVSDSHLIKAREQAVEMSRLNNSITRGQGNVAGFAGEIITADYLGATQQNTYEYDLVTFNGQTIDVKTKRTSVEPRPHYECSVAALNAKQQCDYYAFVRVKNDYSIGWLLGVITPQAYYANAVFMKKGEVDPDNNYVVKSDCYNLSIEELWKISEHENCIRR